MLSRRAFLHSVFVGGVGSYLAAAVPIQLDVIQPSDFVNIPTPEYLHITHGKIEWRNVSPGLDFTRIQVFRQKEVVDVIAAVRVDPDKNSIRVFNSFEGPDNTVIRNIEEWQQYTGAVMLINSSQYMSDPYLMPCALVICDGLQKGPKLNKNVRGMLVAEPKSAKLPKADLLDFQFDTFDHAKSAYTQGVQHWPIILDRKGVIKVNSTDLQANRSVVAKDYDGNILFMTTEGGYFTLYNLGLFLKECGELRIHTAMNLDGGYEADMIVKNAKLSYVTYGQFESNGSAMDVSIRGLKAKIPGVIGVFPR